MPDFHDPAPMSASALYPSMTPTVDTPPTPPAVVTPPSAASLYPSMTPTAPVTPGTPDTADPTAPQDAATETMIPETHYARVEDVERWEAEVQAGPLAASLPAARAFLQQHAPPELVQMLRQTGYGSNPHVIKFVADLAALVPGGVR